MVFISTIFVMPLIMNDLNYRAISLTASEPYHQDTQRDLKPPD